MLVIPFQINPQEYSLFVALDVDGIGRIQQYDPAQIDLRKLPAEYTRLGLRRVLIGYATPEDQAHITELAKGSGPQAALEYLSRGFKFKPEAGDHDGPYLSMRDRGEPKV